MVEFRILCPICGEIIINSSARYCSKCAMKGKPHEGRGFQGVLVSKHIDNW